MKKLLFIPLLVFLSAGELQSQCIQNCAGYTISSINYSLFPTGGVNVNNSFSPNGDDGYTGQVPIGFNFNYYCTTYSTIAICTNGFIYFGTPPSITFADPAQTFPDPTSPNSIVAFNMNDFDVSVGGNVTYTTIGTTPNRIFIVTYSNVPIWNANTVLNSGQILLYETSNNIEIHTTFVGASPYYGTQGIENSSGTAGIGVSGRNNALWSSAGTSSYRFLKTTISTPPTTVAGNTVMCMGTANSFSASAATGVISYSWNLPQGWSGSSTNSAITATAGISGNLSVTATYSGCPSSTPATFSVTVNPAPFISVNSPGVCQGFSVVLYPTGANTYTITGNTFTVTPMVTTNYSIFGMSSLGCAAANTAVATVSVYPIPVITVNNSSICPGFSAVISPSGAGTYSVTGNSFVVSPTVTTNYYVTGTSTDGCVASNTVVSNVLVFPDPTITVNSGSICTGNIFTMNPTGAASYTFSNGSATVLPTMASSYSVVGTSSDGCVSTNTAVSNVFVLNLPNVTAVVSKLTICKGESATLTANGASQYTWSTGSTKSTSVVSPTILTTYSVTGIDLNGCKNTASISVNTNPCTDIKTISSKDFEINIFPNPVSGNLSVIKTNGEPLNSIIIFNNLGQEILNLKYIHSNEQQIDFSCFEKGIYFLQIKTDNQILYKTVLKN